MPVNVLINLTAYVPAGLLSTGGGSVRHRITLGNSLASVDEQAWTENPVGSHVYEYVGSAALTDNIGPYFIEVRTVSAQIQAAYDASTTIVLTRERLGWVVSGVMLDSAADVRGLNGSAVALGNLPGGPAGSGADQVTLSFYSDPPTNSVPIPDADVWVSSDTGGATVVAGTLQTNSAGAVTFLLDAGVEYFIWLQRDGVNPLVGVPFTAVAD